MASSAKKNTQQNNSPFLQWTQVNNINEIKKKKRIWKLRENKMKAKILAPKFHKLVFALLFAH